MKGDTSEVIRKLESQIPSFVQNYSDLYVDYLHILDDIFGTCYIAEKEFFDKLEIDSNALKQIQDHSAAIKDRYIDAIEANTRLFDMYAKAQISALKSFDNYIHVMMKSYAKTLSHINGNNSKD